MSVGEGRDSRGGRRHNIGFSALLDHPVRATLLGLLGVFLFWVVLTKSLPEVVARSNPELALSLSPDHPRALLTLAFRARAQLLALVVDDSTAPDKTSGAGEAQGLEGAGVKPAKLDRDPKSVAVERDRLRSEIRDLATRVIASDPLNAPAFRLLAEVEDDPKRVRTLMKAAAARSRRESTALFWLLNDSFHHKDYVAALDYADVILRTRAQLRPYVMSYLGQMAEYPEGRKLLVERLSAAPSWRAWFFDALPKNSRLADTPLKLMISMEQAGSRVSNTELRPYLATLIQKKRVETAYSVWLQLLSEEALASVGHLFNPSFETDPTGLAFDWEIRASRNAVVEMVEKQGGIGLGRARNGAADKRMLHVGFGVGRVKFAPVRQIVTLVSGRYRLEGKMRGSIVAKRGLRWRVACLYGKRDIIGETEMLLGIIPKWKTFSFEFEVPEGGECPGQMLSLFHDARSASEELISGDVWFDDFQLLRVQD